MSLRAELLRLGIRTLLKRRSGPFNIEEWRKSMRAMERFVPRPPARSQTVMIKAGRLTLHRVTTDASWPERNVLYLHGGAYVSGAPIYYRHFLWRIADALRARVWALEYRLAPEHAFPAALEDAVEAYDWLADHTPDITQLFVAGDSAGGGLALCLLLKLRDAGKALPAAAIALSPWTDLALTGPSLQVNAKADPMLNVEDLPELARIYLGAADPRLPYASPLYGDTVGLPPVLIQVGSDEILRDDAVRMTEKLRLHNARSRLEVWHRMPHAWQLFVPVLPEAHRAIAQIGSFVSEVQR
ncbi:alpha/beta hydrolase [Bradyrhizobium sp. WSM 1738]|uniref:alpha/beta hydrolase n=1 Tax=Bradyrhizobium hereditatis TaxID=2821405 RepID=UPI001CE29BEF|nr:alpha/beta hydrolase [Bradyrhizobium hereditatis]MCA6116179.1 alpha/beta hydrolase [Bradyrhizobium hereditatis]